MILGFLPRNFGKKAMIFFLHLKENPYVLP